MSGWDELVAVALLGTDQQKSPSLTGEDALGQLLGKLEATNRSREAAVLSAAGAIALHTTAGRVPQTVPRSELNMAPDEETPVCSVVGSSRLDLLISGYADSLLPLWLERVAAAGTRVPDACVPALLQYGAAHPALHEAVSKAIGHRGRWLAAQNPEWAFAAGRPITNENLVELFETGSTEERVAAISELRKANPAAARDAVAAAWASDGPETKAKFVRAFKTNLSIDDEPFLEETALGDRRKEVRMSAAALLATIPNSRYQARMIERAKTLVTMKGFLLDKKLEVSLPDTADASMIRDGLTKPTAQIDILFRQCWFREIVETIPPQFWSTQFKLSPEMFIQDAPEILRFAVGEAALLHEDAVWLGETCGQQRHLVADIIASVSPATREFVIARMVAKNRNAIFVPGTEYDQPIMIAMLRSNHNWSEEFARKLVPALVELARRAPSFYANQVFTTVGLYFPTSLLSQMEREFAKIQTENTDYLNNFMDALRFKAELFGDIK